MGAREPKKPCVKMLIKELNQMALQNQVSESELLHVANEIKKAVNKQLSNDVSQFASDWVTGLHRIFIHPVLVHVSYVHPHTCASFLFE